MLGTPYTLYLLNVHAPLEVIETVTVRIEVQCKNGKKKRTSDFGDNINVI